MEMSPPAGAMFAVAMLLRFLPFLSTIVSGSMPKSFTRRLARRLASLTAFFSALRIYPYASLKSLSTGSAS